MCHERFLGLGGLPEERELGEDGLASIEGDEPGGDGREWEFGGQDVDRGHNSVSSKRRREVALSTLGADRIWSAGRQRIHNYQQGFGMMPCDGEMMCQLRWSQGCVEDVAVELHGGGMVYCVHGDKRVEHAVARCAHDILGGEGVAARK